MRKTAFPIALIVFGLAWLGREMGWLPHVNSLAALALMIIGAVILATEGLNRSSIVAGPLLIYIGAAWWAYQNDYLPDRLVWPLGIVVLGVLLFLSRLPGLPEGARRRYRTPREPLP